MASIAKQENRYVHAMHANEEKLEKKIVFVFLRAREIVKSGIIIITHIVFLGAFTARAALFRVHIIVYSVSVCAGVSIK